MNYASSLRKLNSLNRFGIRPGLERIRVLLGLLGDPQAGLPAVHVAGTNGKGSVCAMLDSVLRAEGLRCGLYTSPHLVDLRERFRVAGRAIPPGEFARLFTLLWPAVVRMRTMPCGSPTFFEAATALAFLHFAREGVQVVVLETGLGGRFDATNVLPRPLACVITNISLDHTQVLGGTVERIAWEKAGIAKPFSPLVTAAEGAAARVIRREWQAAQGRARRDRAGFLGLRAGRDFQGRELAQRPGAGRELEFRFLGKRRRLALPLLGGHQHANLACVLGAIQMLRRGGLKVGEKALRQGLARVEWPGRLQVLGRRPLVLLDGAHNPAGAKALAGSLASLCHGRTGMVLGILKDKDWKGIVEPFLGRVDRFFVSAPADPRALSAATLERHLKSRGQETGRFATLAEAFQAGRRWCGPEGSLVVAGSLYTVGEILKWTKIKKA